MGLSSAEDAFAEIRALLDERVEVKGAEDMTVYERVLDLVKSHEAWSDLAIRRLHEIHRLKGSAPSSPEVSREIIPLQPTPRSPDSPVSGRAIPVCRAFGEA